jgi:hypothetical protein
MPIGMRKGQALLPLLPLQSRCCPLRQPLWLLMRR